MPPISLSQANGDPLLATTGGTITFPFRPPILTYVSPTLAHNLWSVSALIGTDGTAQFTPTSVEFFSPLSPEPFLTGSKREQDTLWYLHIPPPPQISSCLPSTLALCNPAQVPVIPDTGTNFLPVKTFPGKTFSTPKIFPGIFSNTFSDYQNFLSTPPTTVLSLFPTVPSIHNVSDASFVLYHHRAFGSPVLSTFLKAIRAGYLASIPRLTATIVLRNPPLSLATSFGHLDACRKGLHSTRQSFPPSLLALTRAQHRATLTPTPPLTPIPLHVPPPTIASPSLDFGPTLYANLTHRSEWMATDLTGRYPVPSRLGHEYVLVTRYLGYIRLTPQVSRTKYAYRDSFRDILAFFFLSF